jgi:hypothetical protein
MDELTWVYGTASLMVGTFLVQVLTRKFDPFAPIWLFFVGYTQIYVIQPLSYHDWAVRTRGVELVTEANIRAFWALALFLGVYFLGPARALARFLPRPPTRWSTTPVLLWTPVLVVWGAFCALQVVRQSQADETSSPEAALLLSFPMVMLVAGSLLIVTGRQPSKPRPAITAAGLAVVACYLLIWMFNGKRSHSLVAVLVGVSSFYIPTLRRPSFPVLLATAMAGMLAVGLSIGWRYYANSTKSYGSISQFADFVKNFDPATILESINLKEKEEKPGTVVSYETEEWGGLLLMMDTVPTKSEYDYGVNYLRVFSTFIPRIIWQDKPIYGRDQWVAAWMAGSEMKRLENFTGPAIGILGATQLNGGATGTAIVLSVVALVLSTSYGYFRRYADVPWVQACWPVWYYNAWFMTVNDDPCNWFYYNFGFTTLPNLVIFWFLNKQGGGERS